MVFKVGDKFWVDYTHLPSMYKDHWFKPENAPFTITKLTNGGETINCGIWAVNVRHVYQDKNHIVQEIIKDL